MKTLIRISKTAPVTIRANGKTTSGAKEYTCQFWQPGVVSYEDCGEGVALLNKETMDKMLPSFVGKPVVIDHVNEQPDEIFAQGKAVGKVTEALWNAETGWYDAKFTVEDPKAQQLIESGYSVSCAFNVMDAGEGGEWHSIKYNEEVTDGSFTHLALVQNPRYEDSKIFKNSKKMLLNSKGIKMTKKNAYCTCDADPETAATAEPNENCPIHSPKTAPKQPRKNDGKYQTGCKECDDKGLSDCVHQYEPKKNDIAGDLGTLMREIKEQLYLIAQALQQKFSSKENSSPLAAEIVEKIPADQITESACVSYALEKGLTRAEGQKAWQDIFRELRSLNSKDNDKSDLRKFQTAMLEKYGPGWSTVLKDDEKKKQDELRAKENAKHGQTVKGPINGMSLVYSEANAGYLLMWHDQLVNIISDKAEALAEFDRCTRENDKENGRAGVFKKGESVRDHEGQWCTIVGEAQSGEYYVVKYSDGSTARMREGDLNNSKENALENGYRLKISPINDKFVGVVYKDEAQVESTMQHPSEDDVHKEAMGIVAKMKGKENAKIVLISIPYRLLEKSDDKNPDQELQQKGFRNVGGGGGVADFEFSGTEQQAASIVKSVLGTMSGVDLGMMNSKENAVQIDDPVEIQVNGQWVKGTVESLEGDAAKIRHKVGDQYFTTLVHKSAIKGSKFNFAQSNDKKNNGILRVSKKNCSDTNAGKSKMFGWFKSKKNAVEDEAKKKAQDEAALKAQEAAKDMKENGEQVNLAEQMVEIDGQQVSLADLIKTYQAEQAEKAAMAANAVPESTMSPEEEIADENGNVYKLGDLVNCHTARKNAADEKAKKEAEEKEAKENSEGGAMMKQAMSAYKKQLAEYKKAGDSEGVKYTEAAIKDLESKMGEFENSAEEKPEVKPEEKELTIEKKNESEDEAKKDEDEAKAKENSKGAKKDIKFFKKLNGLKESAVEIRENGIETLKDKIARGKAKYGAKAKK